MTEPTTPWPADPPKQNEGGLFDYVANFVLRQPCELHPHPSYVSHGLSVSAPQIATLDRQGEFAFHSPVLITRNGTILDGHARWKLAQLKNRKTLRCLEYVLSEQETIEWLLKLHCGSTYFVSYSRIRLALTLAHLYQKQASENQRAGGKSKGQSNLTKDQQIEVRTKIAAIAHSSAGNVTKVCQIMRNLNSTIDQALKSGELSIHRAWTWRRFSETQQLEKLRELLLRRGLTRRSQRMIRKQVADLLPTREAHIPRLSDFLQPLGSMTKTKLSSIVLCEIDSPGSVVYVTKEAFVTLKSLGDQ